MQVPRSCLAQSEELPRPFGAAPPVCVMHRGDVREATHVCERRAPAHQAGLPEARRR